MLVRSIDKIVSLDKLKEDMAGPQGQTVVFTNGCFDLLHPGHISCLEKAAALGDILIVGINSDESVRRIKGESRPLLPEMYRAQMVAALGCVDRVVIFDDSNPVALIKALRPNVHVKGRDYEDKHMPERDVVESYGGQLVLVDLDKGWSTTRLLRQAASLANKERLLP